MNHTTPMPQNGENLHFIQTTNAPAAIGPYAQAVAVGELLFTSGQIPLTPAGGLAEGGIEGQTRQALENLKAILAQAGSAMDQVVKTTVFLKDMNDFARMNSVYAAEFGAHTPARSAVEVARLPRDVLVEIEAIARLPRAC